MPTLNPDNTISITVSDIRETFGAFIDAAAYPDAMIENCIEMSTCFISNVASGCSGVSWQCRANMMELMTCHLLSMLTSAANSGTNGGQTSSGMVVSASIGDVHVSTAVPENKTQLQWYLNQTPYGQQLYALLSIKVSPLYYGGSRQRIFNKW